MNNLQLQEISRGVLINNTQCLSAVNDSAIISFTNGKVDAVFIIGTMFRYGAYGSYAIARKIKESENKYLILNIDSGGGTVDSVSIIVQAIVDARERGQIVIANVSTCCSAAYWIATTCNYIYADSELSIIGSIGVLVRYVDMTKYCEDNGIKIKEIYATKSSGKNSEHREAQKGNFEPYEKSLDKTVDLFIAHIKKYQPNVAEECFAGKTYTAHEAIELGLIHEIIPFKTCLTFK